MSLSPTEPYGDLYGHSFSENDQNVEDHQGDYSTRMEELFADGEGEILQEDEDEGNFIYSGIDAAEMPTGYTERLRDVLGSEPTDDSETEPSELERSSVMDESEDDEDHLVSSTRFRLLQKIFTGPHR